MRKCKVKDKEGKRITYEPSFYFLISGAFYFASSIFFRCSSAILEVLEGGQQKSPKIKIGF